MCPPGRQSCDEGGTKLPIPARYLRAWAAQVSRGTRPSPPLSCGVARRWQRRALPTSEAGGRAVSGGAGGPAGAATPEELLLTSGDDAGTQRSCGQRGLLAPRYPARGAGRCRGAVSAAILRRAPRSGRVLAPQAFGRSPIKVPCPPPLSCGGGTGAREPPPSPAAILRPWGRRPRLGCVRFVEISPFVRRCLLWLCLKKVFLGIPPVGRKVC